MQVLIEDGYVSSYALIGKIIDGIEVPEPPDIEHFEAHFQSYLVRGSSYWDLETGEVVLRAYATTESVIETNERITEIEEQKMYRLVITSSNGNIFKNNNIQTTLSAVVFSWDTNVTDTLDPNQFIWTRVSDDPVADQAWNDAHFGGTKSINITRDDVNVRATFFCDLIDTTTRNSLLG